MYSRSAPSSASYEDALANSFMSAEQARVAASPLAKVAQSLQEPLLDWRYEMRRTAQEVLPGLFVGPYQSSKSLEELHALGITHIVCLFEDREKHLVKPRFIGQFQYLPLLVRDASDQNLISLFPA